MRRVAVTFLLAVALAGAQGALLRHLGGGAVPLALPLVLAVWLGVEAPLLEGLAAAVAVGYAVDVFSGRPQGLLTSLVVALYLTSRLLRSTLAVHGAAGFGAIAACGTFLVGATAFLLVRVTAAPMAAPAAATLWRVLAEALATGVAAAVLRRPLARLERLLAGEPEPDVVGFDR